MSSSRILSVSLAALLLVGGVNVASYAVNGHPLLLGRSNGETRTTILRNTGPGPALELRTRPGAPPLTVSSSRRVPGLNADLVDGIEGDDLGIKAYTYSMGGDVGVTTVTKAFPDLPYANFLVRYVVQAQVQEAGQSVSCHFESIMQTRGRSATTEADATAVSTAATGPYLTLSGWGEVDGRWGVVFTCTGSGAFDVLGGSQAAFIRLNYSQVQQAVTTAP